MKATATIPQVATHDPAGPPVWHECEPGQAPPSPAVALERMRAARAFRADIEAGLKALCVDSPPAPCKSCSLAESCNRMLSTLLTHLLNAAVEQVREENVLIARYRADPRQARDLAAHLAAHDRLLNELSAHVMDWGRLPPGNVRAATSALLAQWNKAHTAMHDEPLMALAAGNASR